MKNHYTAIALFFSATFANGQYCVPTFDFGCTGWNIQSVTAGTLVWNLGSNDCAISDYTAQQTPASAGESLNMSVTDGAWCGCAVWVDFDHSNSFEDAENLYHLYANQSATYTYTFSIAIPGGTPVGAYRMRIVGAWGSDGFTAGSQNGFGPCGAFQYGAFTDFTLNVVAPTGVSGTVANNALTLAPNPACDHVAIAAASPLGQLTVLDAQGRMVEQLQVPADRAVLDTRAWTKGIYTIQVRNNSGISSQRLVLE